VRNVQKSIPAGSFLLANGVVSRTLSIKRFLELLGLKLEVTGRTALLLGLLPIGGRSLRDRWMQGLKLSWT
ncbi:hypothetical protein, partial [Streptococcus suis]|uniref:hypothetical protein n=1 Tax=Streptococcus suis TaxID=1307 RepID=UPI00370C5455